MKSFWCRTKAFLLLSPRPRHLGARRCPSRGTPQPGRSRTAETCRPAALGTEEISLLKKDKPGERVGRKSPEPGKPYGRPEGWLEENLRSTHKKKKVNI